MKRMLVSHALTAVVASFATYFLLVGWPEGLSLLTAHAQTPPPPAGTRQIDLFKTTMNDVMGRVVTIRRTERDPGSGTGAHRHPGSHTFGYVLEGTYEVQLDNGPLRRLGPGATAGSAGDCGGCAYPSPSTRRHRACSARRRASPPASSGRVSWRHSAGSRRSRCCDRSRRGPRMPQRAPRGSVINHR